MGDKEKVPENREKEATLEKVKKAPCGDIFLLILKEFADEENLEFSEDEKKPEILGKITSFDETNPPGIELAYSKEKSLFLTVYRDENKSPDICFIGPKPGEKTGIFPVIYNERRENFNLSDPYNGLLIEILHRVAQLNKSKIEKGQ